MMNIYSQKQRGFTLLEMFVSISVFIVVMLIAVGSLLSIITASKKAQAQKEVLNNLNFAMEGMTRTIRVGTSYHCGALGPNGEGLDDPLDCPGGSSQFSFEHNDGDPNISTDQYIYKLQNGEVQLNKGSGFESVTAPNVTVEYLNFYVSGSVSATEQPLVLITIGGSVQDTVRTRTEFNLETLVSQRLFEG